VLASISVTNSHSRYCQIQKSISRLDVLEQMENCTSVNFTLSMTSFQEVTAATFVASTVAAVNISANSQLTSLEFSNLTSLSANFVISDNLVLSQITFTELTTIQTGVSVVLADNPDLTGISLNNFLTLAGNFLISNSALSDLLMPSVSKITGLFSLSGNSMMFSLRMPVIQEILGTVTVSSSLFNLVDFPLLSILDEAASIQFSQSTLPDLTFPSLTQYNGAITISNCDTMTEISFPKLANLDGSLTLSGNKNLAVIDLSSVLVINGALIIAGNPELTSITFTGLTTLGSLSNLQITNNAAPVEISFPELTVAINGGAFTINSNPNLLSVAFPSMQTSALPTTLFRGNNASFVVFYD